MWTNFLIEEKFEIVKQQSQKLRLLINQAHQYLGDNGLTQIIPVIIGENEKTIKIAQELQSKGYYVLPVRPPTVPVNTSRLRLSLTSEITFEEFKTVIDMVRGFLNAE